MTPLNTATPIMRRALARIAVATGSIGGQRRKQTGNCAGRRRCPRPVLCLPLSDTH